MVRVDPVGFVRPASNHVQTKLAWEVVILDGVFSVRHRIDGRCNIPATLDQYHGMAFPGEGASGDLFQGRGVCFACRLHIHMVGTALALDAEGESRVDVIYRSISAALDELITLPQRDPRMKERKKYGLKAARRAPQFSKR